MRVEYVKTKAERTVVMATGAKPVVDLEHVTVDLVTLEDLIVLRAAHIDDAYFRFLTTLDDLVRKVAVERLFPPKRQKGRKKGCKTKGATDAWSRRRGEELAREAAQVETV